MNKSNHATKDNLRKTQDKEIHDMTPGELLKKHRLKQGLSLETIHEATKIPLDALRAIEEGYNIRVLTPFYIKGFIKIYAKYLEINIHEVLNDSKEEKLPEHIKSDGLDGSFDLQLFLSRVLTRKRKKQILSVIGILFAFFVLFKIVTAFTHHKKQERSQNVGKAKVANEKSAKRNLDRKEIVKRDKKVVAKKKTLPKKKIVSTTKDKVIAIKKTAQPEKSNVVKKGNASVLTTRVVSDKNKVSKAVTLTVRARKKGWIAVKSDGVIVFRSSIRKGAVETWLADKDIEISGNIINQLDFELNGKMIGPLGRKARKAKRVVITKDGLKVSK